MFNPDADTSPINPLPPVIIVMVAIIAGIELILQAGAHGYIGGPQAVGWRNELVRELAFSNRYLDYLIESRSVTFDGIWRFFTYTLVGRGGTNTLIACVILLAIGNGTARLFGWPAMVAAYLICSAFGALVHYLTMPQGLILIGAFPPVYGFLGLFTWSLWMVDRKNGGSGLPAFKLIAILTLFQLTVLLLFGSSDGFVAELAAFFAGFAIAFLIGPGSRARLGRWRRGLRER